MSAVSLTTLRARARERADMPVAGFIADSATSIDAWINEGVQKLTELLIKAYGQGFLEVSQTLNTVAGQTDYTLTSTAANLLVLYGVDLAIGGFSFSLLPYNKIERNLRKNLATLSSWYQRPSYQITGGGTAPVLRLLPAPDGAYVCTLHFAPSATLLVNGGDTVNFPNGWERYVVVYAAIQMLMKEESDVRELRVELDKMEAELNEIAERRDAGSPHSVADAEAAEDDNPLNYF